MNDLAKAFVKAQKSFGPALKNSNNPHFRTKYADLASCIDAVIDSFNANGIALLQSFEPSEHGVAVKTVFMHETGEKMDCGTCVVPVSKNDPQGYGSALTYARRYSLMTACGIAPEDDDGNAAQKSVAKPQQAPQPAKQDRPPLALKEVLTMAQQCATEDDLKKWFITAKTQFNDDESALSKITGRKDEMKKKLIQPQPQVQGLTHIGAMLPGATQ